MFNVESLERAELGESLLTWSAMVLKPEKTVYAMAVQAEDSSATNCEEKNGQRNFKIQTFNVEAPCQTVEDLTSGVVMAQVLQKIDPAYFDENWLNRIKTEVGDNWRLKVSNLKKILKGILDYNHEILGQQINDFTLPDVNLIGEHADAAELGRMLQLILGCAVNCEQKQEYIQTIMMMEESVQHVVMTAIQELMSKESPVSVGNDAYVDLDRQLKKTTEELNEALATKEEIAQRCHELDMQVAALQEEKSSLLAENQILMERLNQSDSIEDPNSLQVVDTCSCRHN
ncbi:hypothetical protein DUI87_00633 [Hirundo rustica rustica]|uniref:Calponin-homology (CH) domain-containing protein n=1 Tax=Hirundo rustica rustica TaxID=333673 RepID=A0A3M0LB22_HIRRU|nr:hypothetical protein DUI87_00633 [Hirundo rustica rustica]